MSFLNRSGRKSSTQMFEAMESRAMLSAPTISAFTFATGTQQIANGNTFNRTAAAGLTFNVTATPDTPGNKVTKVQIVADNDNSGTISEGDVILGVAKATGTANQYSLTVKGKKALNIPAGVSGKTVDFLVVATAKDRSVAFEATKSLVINGNQAPTAGTIVITGPTKTSGVAANGEANFKIKGFKDSDGKIVSYTLIWDADNTGTFTPARDFVFGITNSTSETEVLPVSNGKLNADLINFPTNGSVSFIVIATDNNGDTVSQLSTTVAVKTGPTVGATVTDTPNNTTKKNTFSVSSIAKGTSNGSAALKSVTFYADTNTNGRVDKGDKVVGKVKLTPTSTNATVEVKNSKVANKFVLAVVEDTLGFTSNVATTSAFVVGIS